MRRRILGMAVLIAMLLSGVAARIFQLTLGDRRGLAGIAERQHRDRIQLAPERGPIVDRNGETLAATAERPSIFIRPRHVRDGAATRAALTTALRLPPDIVASKLASRAPFVWLKRAVTPQERDAVRALGVAGIGELPEARRLYPHGRVAAHVLGFTNVDVLGLEGVERQYERDLRALPRLLDVERDALGREILTDGVEDPIALRGATVQLTIDLPLQDATEAALERGLAEAKARAGSVIVLDPWTGEILALANLPSFDPNQRASARPDERRNRGVTDVYEPGSTLKALLAAAALDSGAVRADELFFCENGNFPVGRWMINDHHPHGWLSVGEILQVSSNIGAAKIGERLGRDRLHGFLRAVGFGEPTGIDLPGEVGGMMRPVTAWSRIELVTTSFGQGIAVTPIQMARAFAAIANGGVLLKPFVGLRATAADGAVLWEHQPAVIRRVMRAETAHTVTAMLERVLAEGGTGERARLDGFRVAGKTGTAQKVDPATGRYSARGRVATFIGFLPAEAPRVVILALVDEPTTSTYGGIVAAPVFRAVAAAAMERFGVLAPVPSDATGVQRIADGPADAAVPEGMPSFIGLSMRVALDRARELGWSVQVVGNGYVQRQSPPPGAVAAPGKELLLTLAPSDPL